MPSPPVSASGFAVLGLVFANDLKRSELSRFNSVGTPILVACSPDPDGASFGFDIILFSPEAFGSFEFAKADFVSRLTGSGAGGGLAPDLLCSQASLTQGTVLVVHNEPLLEDSE